MSRNKKKRQIVICSVNYNLSDFTLFIYAIIDIMNIIIDKTCDILISPSIKLSVLSPSIIALANEYIIKYRYVINRRKNRIT